MSKYQGIGPVLALALEYGYPVQSLTILLPFAPAHGVWLSCAEFDHIPYHKHLLFLLSALLWLTHCGCVSFPDLLQVLLNRLGFPLMSTIGAQHKGAKICFSCLGAA